MTAPGAVSVTVVSVVCAVSVVCVALSLPSVLVADVVRILLDGRNLAVGLGHKLLEPLLKQLVGCFGCGGRCGGEIGVSIWICLRAFGLGLFCLGQFIGIFAWHRAGLILCGRLLIFVFLIRILFKRIHHIKIPFCKRMYDFGIFIIL